jgi:hypothetical protein
MRTCNSKAIVFLAGILIGAAGVLAWGGRSVEQTAAAQAPVKDAGPARFAISSWSAGGSVGTYILDVQTGDVFLVSGEDKPSYRGRAEKK